MEKGSGLTGVELAAQALEGDVNDVGAGLELQMPDLLKEFGASDGAAFGAQQTFEQGVFAGGEIYDDLGATHLVTDGVYLKVGDGVGENGLGGVTSQDGAKAGAEFTGGERLGQVIVGTEIESGDAVFERIAGGKDEDGQTSATEAEAAKNFQPIEAGKHEVEHEGVVSVHT